MGKAVLDKLMPMLTEIELAEALLACRMAGAEKAARALSLHLERLRVVDGVLLAFTDIADATHLYLLEDLETDARMKLLSMHGRYLCGEDLAYVRRLARPECRLSGSGPAVLRCVAVVECAEAV